VRVLIIGGGVGGLAASIGLARHGIESVVFEQGESETGAGLSLWSNAMRVLRWLGVEREALAAGSLIERTVTVTCGGRPIAEMDIAGLGREAGAPSICIARAELRKILLHRISLDRLKTSARCVSYAVREHSVIAHMADGSTAKGDLLVGADGIHSIARAKLLGSAEPRYAGYTCWRGLVTGDWLKAGTAMVAMGRGTHAGLFPCGSHQAYWFGTVNAPARATVDLSSLIDSWPEPIAAAIRATSPGEILRNDIFDRAPAAVWGQGPVTLLGDAAHPATPNLGQGACQALEDAKVLTECLLENRPAGESLRAYERLRMPRTAMVTREARNLGRLLQIENPIVMPLRDMAARTTLAQRMAMQLFRRMLVD